MPIKFIVLGGVFWVFFVFFGEEVPICICMGAGILLKEGDRGEGRRGGKEGRAESAQCLFVREHSSKIPLLEDLECLRDPY